MQDEGLYGLPRDARSDAFNIRSEIVIANTVKQSRICEMESLYRLPRYARSDWFDMG
jgi:hypothetical protein